MEKLENIWPIDQSSSKSYWGISAKVMNDFIESRSYLSDI